MNRLVQTLALGLALSRCAARPAATPSAPATHAEAHRDALAEVPLSALSLAPEAVDAVLAPLRVDEGVPAVEVAFVSAGRVAFVGSGHRREGQPAPDADTVFAIGSVTKVLTATLLATLLEAHQLTLDTDLQSLVEGTMRVPHARGVITLRHLVTHRAGLPRMPPGFAPAAADDPYADFDVAALARSLAATAPEHSPGARFEYSNFGFGLLGHALGRFVGLGYRDALRERVLAPLAMTNTHVDISPALAAVRADDHDPDGRVVRPWRFDALAGAGAAQSTARDLARWIDLSMNPRGPLAGALRRSQEPLADADPGLGGHVAMAWFDLPSERCLFHNGQTGGAASFIAFDRETQRGVVLLANQSSQRVTPVGLNLLRLLRGEAPRSLSQGPPRPAVPLDAAAQARLAGVYRLSPEMTLTVRFDGPRCEVEATGQRALRCDPLGPAELWVRAVGATVTFALPAAGPASGLTLRQNGREHPAPRAP